jgi:hypothetical protein
VRQDRLSFCHHAALHPRIVLESSFADPQPGLPRTFGPWAGTSSLPGANSAVSQRCGLDVGDGGQLSHPLAGFAHLRRVIGPP